MNLWMDIIDCCVSLRPTPPARPELDARKRNRRRTASLGADSPAPSRGPQSACNVVSNRVARKRLSPDCRAVSRALPFDETKHLVGSIDGHKELVRSGMQRLGATFPAANLRLFSTHTVCNEATMDHLKMRADACDSGVDDEKCEACYDDVQVCLSGKCYDGEREAARQYALDGAEVLNCTVPAGEDRLFCSMFCRGLSRLPSTR